MSCSICPRSARINPMHKKAFSLDSGKCLGGEDYRIDRYPIKVEDCYVHIQMIPLD